MEAPQESFTNTGCSTVSMRGGALVPAHDDDETDNGDEESGDEDFQSALSNTSKRQPADAGGSGGAGAWIPQKSTRYNRERIIANAAGKPKAQKWADWLTEQSYQDKLQRNSWIKDQGVVEPGKMPAAPVFGPTSELMLRVGSSMPTIYAQRLTPTDIKYLQDENQKLRNQVLDRMWACQICDMGFETYGQDKQCI